MIEQTGHLFMRIFINDEKELRAGWRVVCFIMAVATAMTLITGVIAGLAILFPSIRQLLSEYQLQATGISSMAGFAVDRMSLLAGALAATAVCARLLEKRTASSVGYKLHRGWLRDFCLGSLIGLAMLVATVGIQELAGAVDLKWRPASASIAGWLAFALLQFFIAAAAEELLFRGFAFQALVRGSGPVVAIVVTSGGFALIHLSNPDTTLFSTVNTGLAGVWLGIAYLVTRSLWLPTALHYSWNLAMALLFGLPVSGLRIFPDLALTHGTPAAPLWVSGGDYGPEGGAAATFCLLVCSFVIWKARIFTVSEEMKGALRRGTTKAAPLSITPERYKTDEDASEKQP